MHPSLRLQLCIGLPDRSAFEQVLETLPPLGVTRITPIICAYCQKPWWRKNWDRHRERFSRKLIVACKQCRNPLLPVLDDPSYPADRLTGHNGVHFVAQQQGSSLFSDLPPQKTSDGPCDIWIGPPGGFSPAESDLLRTHGAVSLCLGRFRLRTEQAASAAAAQFMVWHLHRHRPTPRE